MAPAIGFGDDETQGVSNQVLEDIFQDIQSQKDKYEDLKLFTRFALKMGPNGFYEIKYSYEDPLDQRRKDKLEFWVSILPLDEKKEISDDFNVFERKLRLLNLKIIGSQNVSRKKNQIDIEKIIDRHVAKLLEYEAKYLPVSFRLAADKDTFKVGEIIEFYVILENKTAANLKVNELNSRSLIFQYGTQKWGADENAATTKGTTLLRPYKTLKQKFNIKGFSNPGNIELTAKYLVYFEGILPTATLDLKIQ
jgi:hypothetical protein